MNRVYILYDHSVLDGTKEISNLHGAVSSIDVAAKFVDYPIKDNLVRCYTFLELDDPELLNRIAKEVK